MAYTQAVQAGAAAAFEQVSVDNTSGGVALTLTNYGVNSELAEKAVIVVETAQIRFTIDGTTPTSSVGMLADPGDVLTLTCANDIKNFKAIRATSTTASIDVTYFRPGVQ